MMARQSRWDDLGMVSIFLALLLALPESQRERSRHWEGLARWYEVSLGGLRQQEDMGKGDEPPAMFRMPGIWKNL